MIYEIKENDSIKKLTSKEYNYVFDKTNGNFARWGKTFKDDPNYCKYGPEILDIEVTTSCKGPGGIPCSFCYKSNTPNGKNMSLSTFKKILRKMPDTCMQLAFGADAQCESNPDIWAMAEFTRDLGMVPNITVADISDEVADKLSNVMGAVAVSRYANKDLCYNSVKKLTDRGMSQVNIHMMISQETFEQAKETLRDYSIDERLAKLNAVILLSLKTKGRGESHHPLTESQFRELVDYAFDNNISLGFDSCSAPKFAKAIEGRDDEEQLLQCTEPCESTCFSSYVDVGGNFYPCSFCEGIDGWEEGLDVANCNDFIDDVWNHERTKEFRTKLLSNCRNCPVFEV